MKTGLVVEGGGMKCAYSAGILDKFLDDDITFSYCIGVSAGAANTLSYLAGQRGRNLRFYTEHLRDPRYLSVRSLVHTGNLFGLQYIYGTLTNSDDPLDYSAVMENPAEFYMPATDAATGRATYFSKYDIVRDDYRAVMASCALPGFCRPVKVGDRYYYDGGVADSIPIIRSLKTGHRKNVIILTRNFGYRKKEGTRGWELYVAAFRKYPNLVRALVNRAKHYNQVLECIEKWEEEGSVFVIRPEIPAVSRLEKDEEKLREFYQHGYDQMKANFEALQEFLKEE